MHAISFLRLALSLILLVAGLFVVPVAPARATGDHAPLSAVFTVSTTADTGPGSLRMAIKAANNTAGSDKILFSISGPIELLAPLPVISGPLTMIGGATLRGNDFAAFGNEALPMMQVSPRAVVTLRGIVFETAAYGAISNRGDLRVEECTFTGNQAWYGGAIHNSGKLLVKRSNFVLNISDEDGGAIYNSGSLQLQTVNFDQNKSFFNSGALFSSGTLEGLDVVFHKNEGLEDSGGALFNTGQASLTRVTFEDNEIHNGGGAIWNNGGLVLTQAFFHSNGAKWGGAIINWTAGNLTIQRSTFSQNGAAHFGGALDNYGTVTLTDTAVEDNFAYDLGGGINNEGAAVLIRVRFEHNTGGWGGAISNSGRLNLEKAFIGFNSAMTSGGGLASWGLSDAVTVINTTFSGNSAVEQGGGILNEGGLNLSFATLAYNQAPSGGAIFNAGTLAANGVIAAYSPAGGNCGGAAVMGTGSLSDDATCSGFDVADPRLAPLATIGATRFHRPLLSSLAINHLPVGTCSAADDQLGTLRPQGPACDSGAVEVVQ